MGRIGIPRLKVNLIENPIRMQGQYEDHETGLYYNRYRYFDPNICAYVSQDPLGLLAGENVYCYPWNSFGYADPLGLKCPEASGNEVNKKTTYEGKSRKDALRQAKRDSSIPNSQKPKVEYDYLDDGNGNKIISSDGNPIQTRNYHYTNIKNEKIIIQEHSLGHTKATPLHGAEPHFNVRPFDNPRTGSVEGTHGHYNF